MKPTSGSAIRHKLPETESIYVSYYVKYSSNWVGYKYGPHQFYFSTNVDNEWIGPAYTHLTAYVEQNKGEPVIAIQDAKNIDESRIGVNLTNITEKRAVAGCNGNSDGYGNGNCYLTGSFHNNVKQWRAGKIYFQDIPGAYYKNDWHFIEVYMQLNSISNGKGIADGVIRYWYDNNLIIDCNDVVLRTGQHPNMKFNQFMMGPYMGGSTVDQALWIDDLTIAPSRLISDLQPSLLSPSTPTQPLNLRIIE
jgi:hypothetical protein